jgi:type IV pilus assembly protein PilC
MAKFVYKARSIDGQLVEGVRKANSEQEAIFTLKNEGMAVFYIEEVKDSGAAKKEKELVKRKSAWTAGRIKSMEIAVFCRQLATLINAGVSILDAIEDMSVMVTNARFKGILASVASDIKQGSSLSEGMKKYQDVFGRIFVSLVAAGEKSGKLGKILYDLSAYLEGVVKLKRKVQSASAYPLFVAGFFSLILAGLVLFLVPRFKIMYASFGAELPLPTRIVMGISDLAVRNFPLVLIATVLLVIAIAYVYKTEPGRLAVDNFKLKVPIFGPIMTKIILARFFQTLSTLVRSGVDIVGCLDIASQVINNLPVERMVLNIKNRIVEGSSLADEFDKKPLFPKMIVRMTSIGEKSGKLDEMFSKLSDYYTDEVDGTMANLSSIIEPLLIIILGIIIGVVVIVLYLPIFKLGLAVMGKT